MPLIMYCSFEIPKWLTSIVSSFLARHFDILKNSFPLKTHLHRRKNLIFSIGIDIFIKVIIAYTSGILIICFDFFISSCKTSLIVLNDFSNISNRLQVSEAV
jgi:hypothetical protein